MHKQKLIKIKIKIINKKNVGAKIENANTAIKLLI